MPSSEAGSAHLKSGMEFRIGRSHTISPDVVIDRTHMRRRASGIERITDVLFSAAALAPLRVSGAEASGRRSSMIFRQMVPNPCSALRQPGPACIFPGYPPSPSFRLLRDRTVLYVDDLFLLTRKQDLNWTAQVCIAPCFRHAITRLRYFLVNSTATARELAQ